MQSIFKDARFYIAVRTGLNNEFYPIYTCDSYMEYYVLFNSIKAQFEYTSFILRAVYFV